MQGSHELEVAVMGWSPEQGEGDVALLSRRSEGHLERLSHEARAGETRCWVELGQQAPDPWAQLLGSVPAWCTELTTVGGRLPKRAWLSSVSIFYLDGKIVISTLSRNQ